MDKAMGSVAVILGSAFDQHEDLINRLQPIDVETEWGKVTLYQVTDISRPAFILFRHGQPHQYLPHQIPYRAHIAALRKSEIKALLVTSSVGVLNAKLPLFKLLSVSDLLMLDNRLPDGSTCTMFANQSAEQGHLVSSEGLISLKLVEQLKSFANAEQSFFDSPVVFGYAGGPRTKTRAENRAWTLLGADVNSMSLGPELVLANELEIPCAACVVGHKYSLATEATTENKTGIKESLDRSRDAMYQLVNRFLEKAEPPPFANYIYRFKT